MRRRRPTTLEALFNVTRFSVMVHHETPDTHEHRRQQRVHSPHTFYPINRKWLRTTIISGLIDISMHRQEVEAIPSSYCTVLKHRRTSDNAGGRNKSSLGITGDERDSMA